MYWSPGDRVLLVQDGLAQPATIRGGERVQLADERGAPTGFTETYLVTLDSEMPALGRPGKLRSIDGRAILGAAPS